MAGQPRCNRLALRHAVKRHNSSKLLYTRGLLGPHGGFERWHIQRNNRLQILHGSVCHSDSGVLGYQPTGYCYAYATAATYAYAYRDPGPYRDRSTTYRDPGS